MERENDKLGVEKLLDAGVVKGYTLFPLSSDGDVSEVAEMFRKTAVLPCQTHSLNVGIVLSREDRFPDTDALITFARNIPIGVVTADCVPILLYAPDIEAIAAIHAGWKGTLGGITSITINKLIESGADVKQIIAAFGPSISFTAYQVSEELAQQFRDNGFDSFISYPEGKGSKPHLDLQAINRELMVSAGMVPHNIITHRGCSFLSIKKDGTPIYQSHRRSQGAPGRNMTIICRY